MTGIMGARSQFVNKQMAIFADEKLNAKDPDDFQFLEYRASNFSCFDGHICGNPRGSDRQIENTVAVMVFNSAVMNKVAVDTSGRHDRDFTLEVYEGLKHGLSRANSLPRRSKIG